MLDQRPVPSRSEPDDEYPIVTCPMCGVEQTDLDGFGVVFCPACRYCQHLSRDGGVCGICGVEPEGGE